MTWTVSIRFDQFESQAILCDSIEIDLDNIWKVVGGDRVISIENEQIIF
jgi:hypothetical protein